MVSLEEIREAREKAEEVRRRIDKVEEIMDVTEYRARLDELEARTEENHERAIKEARELEVELAKEIGRKEAEKKFEKEKKRLEEEIEMKKAQELLSTPEFIEAAKAIPTEVIEAEPELPELSPEEVEEARRRYEELKREIDSILKRPDVRRRGKLFRNWVAHYKIIQGISKAFCPRCDEKSGKLVWSCCELPIEEAYKMAGDEYEKSQKK